MASLPRIVVRPKEQSPGQRFLPMSPITFYTTHWSVVLAAKGDDSKARVALSELCKSYREPVLRYIEFTIKTDTLRYYGGRSAEDLTHDFLIQLLEGKWFAAAERCEGRFRTYLLGAVRYFLRHIREQALATKRGGKVVYVPMLDDIPQTEDAIMFDRDWAQTIIDRATVLLGDAPETQKLLPWLTHEMTTEDRERIVAELGKSETAIKVALHRLRKKFRRRVRELIAHTVESDTEIDAELDYLIQALTQ